MGKATILVVDDMPENIDILIGILGSDYKIKVATNGKKALELAVKFKPDLILLDVMMPEIGGYETCEKLKQEPLTSSIPIIFVTAMSDVQDETMGFEIGGVDYITKPVSPPVVKARVKLHLSLYKNKILLKNEVNERTRELEQSRLEIIRRLGRAAEYKDNETGLHIVRMSHYCWSLANQLGMSDKECELIYHAAAMHDIGKIGIPENVLKKTGKLNAEEWDLMKQHPLIGAEIIGEHSDPLLNMAYKITLTHNEKWDGSGYPNGLKGEAIPLGGRIAAIADVFDTLTSVRPYKEAYTFDAAMQFIEDESGKHFDPELVSNFKKIQTEIKSIFNDYTRST